MTSFPQLAATTTAEVFRMLREKSTRLVSIFGRVDEDGKNWVHYILDVDNREYRVLKASAEGPVSSATSITPAAAWYERELHDQFGIQIDGHPDLRPLVFHQNWPDGVHPLSGALGDVPWASGEYQFLKVDGVGVCEVPVGPVHAGIIEPGHFRFSVVGDTILHLELRHFYTHKGTERLFQGTPVMNGAMIAESVSGDNCFSHAVAYCQAVEAACNVAAPPRAQGIRLVGQEVERLMAHIGDVGALCGDVGFSVPAAYTSRLKEALLRESANILGTRYWRTISIPGGVTRDISPADAGRLRRTIKAVAREFTELAQMILDTPSVQNRFESTGILKPEAARYLAVVGPVARASGIHVDVRHHHPHGAYRNWQPKPVTYHYGDVLARARVRIDEVAASVLLLDEVLANLPSGEIVAHIDGMVSADGFSAVESPRGELLYWLEMRKGQIARCHIKSPSFQNWPALPLTMPGNIIADFPLINKSFNLSYSGCDR
jgi:Ni,Fe-hydrogenase III large subunit/Ni,Fe-hydrogenase III component G